VRTRLCGLALLLVCAVSLHFERALVIQPPRHQPSVLEMLLSLAAVLSGVAGAMCAAIGHALFEPYEWPPRDRD
jgi:hypothetical protein